MLIIALQDFFKYLAANTGLDTVNLSNVWSLQDTLFVEVSTAIHKSDVHETYTNTVHVHVHEDILYGMHKAHSVLYC